MPKFQNVFTFKIKVSDICDFVGFRRHDVPYRLTKLVNFSRFFRPLTNFVTLVGGRSLTNFVTLIGGRPLTNFVTLVGGRPLTNFVTLIGDPPFH